MKKKNQGRYQMVVSIITLLAFFLPFAWAAAAGEDLKVTLTSRKVITNKKGKEIFESFDKMQPGDKIEYQAVYKNEGKKKVTRLMGIVPIPVGMEYIQDSVNPTIVDASVDGKTYARVPLKRTITRADGKEEISDIPVSEYRFLRWSLGDVPSGKSVAVRARAMVAR